jgi:hypothetical protein
MHLAGEAHGGNIAGWGGGLGQYLLHRIAGGAPPIVRILLRPPSVRRSEGRVFGRATGNDLAFAINHDSSRATGSNVDSQEFCRHENSFRRLTFGIITQIGVKEKSNRVR